MTQSFHGLPSQRTEPTVTGATKPSHIQKPPERPDCKPLGAYALAKKITCKRTYAITSALTKLMAYAGRAFFCLSAFLSGVHAPQPISSVHIFPNKGPYQRKPIPMFATAATRTAR